jgi:hypothetical protein
MFFYVDDIYAMDFLPKSEAIPIPNKKVGQVTMEFDKHYGGYKVNFNDSQKQLGVINFLDEIDFDNKTPVDVPLLQKIDQAIITFQEKTMLMSPLTYQITLEKYYQAKGIVCTLLKKRLPQLKAQLHVLLMKQYLTPEQQHLKDQMQYLSDQLQWLAANPQYQ